MPGIVKVGATRGLARVPHDRQGDERTQDHAPEQVYVYVDTLADWWTDVDDRRHSPRAVIVEGCVGYGTRSRMRLTRDQAAELRDLLGVALDEDDRWGSMIRNARRAPEAQPVEVRP